MRAAAQQALEALEELIDQTRWQAGGQDEPTNKARHQARAAIEALRTALAQPEGCWACEGEPDGSGLLCHVCGRSYSELTPV